MEEAVAPRAGTRPDDKWRIADMEDRTGDPGKGLMRAKGKMRETMVDGGGGREGGGHIFFYEYAASLLLRWLCGF